MQQALIAGCYLSPSTPGYTPGSYQSHDATYFAVRQLQNQYNTTNTDGRGVFGPATIAALVKNPHGIC
jgi:hypothetical protein